MKIICFTGSRAEYYLLKPLFLELQNTKKFEIFLIVSGGILTESNSQTLRDIEKDGIKIFGRINLERKSNHAIAIGKLCIEVTSIIEEIKPNLGIVYADRFESFGFAIAVSHSNIPLIHLEAGDITEGGTYDDQIRHCISKLSHLYCTSTLKGCETIKRLGEEKWRYMHSGLISYDDMREISEIDRVKIIKNLKIDKNEPIVVGTFHPIPRDLELTKKETIEFIEGLKLFSNRRKSKIILTAPNNDSGKEVISNLINKNLSFIRNATYIESLGGNNYHSIMSLANEMKVIICGNSSSVIKEAPYYGAHSLNIGIRQLGRESASTQINCDANRSKIEEALTYLAEKNCSVGINPYYKENPSKEIISFIQNVFLEKSIKEIMFKKWS